MNPLHHWRRARRRRPLPYHFCSRLRCLTLEDRTVPASFQGLGFLPGGTQSYPTGISADGSVVVGSCPTAFGTRAFRWTTGTGMVDLGMLP
jgi:probable HAF family extracellular repeat protein